MPSVPIHVIIPVWGKVYTQCLIDVGLPAIMAPGNLPALGDDPRHLCHIITTEADRHAIETSAVFPALSATIAVRFHEIDQDPIVSGDRHVWQSYCNRVGIKAADEVGAAMVFLNPDVVIADGGLKALSGLLERGKRAIQVLGVRLIREAVVPVLTGTYRTADATRLTISPRELISLAMGNLHPLTQVHEYERADLDLGPSMLLWRAAEEGMVARCFHLHPMLVYPRVRNAPFSTTIDDDYLRAACPDAADEYIVADSDEFCACELSGLERPAGSLPRSPSVAADVAAWAATAARPQHYENVVRRIILHAGQTDADAWRRACAVSDETINRVLKRVLDLKLHSDLSRPFNE